MAIRLIVDDRVKFKVEGSFADRSGRHQPFSFSLVCDRIDVDQVTETVEGGGRILDFFSSRTHDWDGVQDADGKAIAFSEAGLADLFRLPGVPALTWRRYLEEIGAKAKN